MTKAYPEFALRASAPGSLMLFGEYAVLQGHHALVCAVDKRITVTLTPRTDDKIWIESVLGEHHTTLVDLTPVPPFQFVLSMLHFFKEKLKHGCHLKIESEFSATIGFASSAAVTVATLSVIEKWLGLSFSSTEKIELARTIIRQVQGMGSGADVAACVTGGIVFYRMHPLLIEPLPHFFPLTVVYSGNKTPTVQAVERVEQSFSDLSVLFDHLLDTINQCTWDARKAIGQKEHSKLGKLMDIQQGLMDSLGVNTAKISGILTYLRQQPEILGAKISGSGLGDCVIAVGVNPVAIPGQIEVSMTKKGVYCEEV